MTALKLENLKPNDWIIGESAFFDTIMPIVRQVKAYPKYDKNMGQDYTLTLNDDILSKSNYKYLTIKPKAMQKGTVIHCPEKWMAEALCWVMNRLGKKWCDGESFLGATNWEEYKSRTCYNFNDCVFGDCSYHRKVIPFWDAVCGEDSADVYNNKEGEMCEEKKYEWNTNNIIIYSIIFNATDCKEKKDFKTWCFDRFYMRDATIITTSAYGKELLSELHKPERKAWLDFAIEQGYVKEVEPEETFSIGDVIEFTEKMPNVENRYIINICKEDTICLNSKKGTRGGNMFPVEDVESIKYEEIYDKIRKNFKKVGYGVKDLL
jgi:hypothetical protein